MKETKRTSSTYLANPRVASHNFLIVKEEDHRKGWNQATFSKKPQPLRNLEPIQNHVLRTSQRLIGLPPEEIPQAIITVLADCCAAAGVDGVVLVTKDLNGEFRKIYQFWPNNFDLTPLLPDPFPCEQTPTLIRKLIERAPFELSQSHFSDPLSAEEQDLFQSSNIRSVLGLPLAEDEQIIAGLYLLRLESVQSWDEYSWACLQQFGSICQILLNRLHPLSGRIEELRLLVGGSTESIFHAVIDSLSEGVSCCDNEGFVIYTNPSWERITGYSLEEVRGKRIYEFLFRKEDRGFQAQQARQHERYEDRRRGVPERYSAEITRKDGTKRQIEVYASPLRNELFGVVGSIGIITDRKGTS